MGAFMSKHPGDYERVNTPPQPQRQLSFDPRSPSAGIDRTPIIVPATPAKEKTTPTHPKEKLNQLLDPRSPAEEFIRTPVLTPIKFDFSELEEALKHCSSKRLHATPKDEVSKEISRPSNLTFTAFPDQDGDIFDPAADVVSQRTPPSTPTKTRVFSTTPLAVRCPNVACPSPGLENQSVKEQLSLKDTEYTSIKVIANGKTNLRQMAHHQSHARGKAKGQKRLGGAVQDENSPRPIQL